MSKSAIVSLATKNSNYVNGLARLSNSLRDNSDGVDFLGFIHECSVGAPLHSEHPYAFKVHAIQKAIDAGYTRILWLDVSAYAVAPVQPLFDIITEQGYWFEGAGCWLGEWCNDKTLEYYHLTRDQEIPMVQSGFMGFNIAHDTGRSIWRLFQEAYHNELFHGDWQSHRHDQSCMSAIIRGLRLPFSHLPEYVQYAGIYDKVLNDKIILKCQGT
jgi:hypothetical protein